MSLAFVVPPVLVLEGTTSAYAALKKKKKKPPTKKPSSQTKKKHSSGSYGGGGVAGGAAGGAVAEAALSQDTVDKANQALQISQRICLVGSTVKFGIDVTGRLNVSKTSQQGTASASVNALTAEGGVLFQNEEIRQIVDEKIRNCMMQQWPAVVKILRDGVQ